MKKLIFIVCCMIGESLSAQTRQLAFPGAEGFGKYTSGGRGGKVLTVTNLNDSGTGSFREAANAKGPRTIVFALSGTISLESRLVINEGDLTIAGQTAPGDGICIKNYTVTISASNVIVRYMRFRLGDERKYEDDAFNGRDNSNIIIDHCSMSWSIDEAASFYHNKDFTMQWCIIAESLVHSFHAKGPHGYGGIWGGEGASFHHNLIASHSSRNPRFSGSSTTMNPADELVDFTNNVIYNWGFNSVYGGEQGKYNMVNNYYKPGPATVAKVKGRLLNPDEPLGKFYLRGNYLAGNEIVTANNWLGVQGADKNPLDAAKADRPFPVVAIAVQTAQEAYQSVLAKAGASLKRDAVDWRIIRDVASGTAKEGKDHNGLIDSQTDVGGWPELQSLPAAADRNHNGIPDDSTLHLVRKKAQPKEITVAQDGSGDYQTIQTAVNSVRDLGQGVTIHIKKGVYHEKLVIPSWKIKITLIGESKENTIISNNDYSGKIDSVSKEKLSTHNSYTVLVQGDDFTAENLTIENTAGRVGQAVALHVEGDRCMINNCNLLGNQDTLYATKEGSRQYYKDCLIEGTTDFIFGSATAVFHHCTIKSLVNSFITAASTVQGQQFGFVFMHCRLIADPAATKVFLGRPWRPYAKTVFLHCEMGSQILAEGWNPWKGDAMFPDKDKTAYYAEFANTGEGALAKNRVPWSKQLLPEEAKAYTLNNILGGADHWIPSPAFIK